MEQTTLTFLFVLTFAVAHGRQYPDPWPRSNMQQVQHRRMTVDPTNLAPYNENLDPSKWLDTLLGSLLTAEPSYNAEQRTQTSAQRIFQREARPSLSFLQDSPSGKRRFSLASVRVNPNSVKRQQIFAVPDMTLLQLENPTRLPISAGTIRPTVKPPLPQHLRDNNRQPIVHYTQQSNPVYREEESDYPGESSFDHPAEGSSSLRERHVDINVYVNRYS